MIDPKLLKKFLNRPEQMSADELEDNDDPSAENPDEAFSVPAQIKAGLESDFESDEGEIDDSAEETKELDELEEGNPAKDETRESDGNEQQISSPNASIEVRKKAIAETLKKYLGR